MGLCSSKKEEQERHAKKLEQEALDKIKYKDTILLMNLLMNRMFLSAKEFIDIKGDLIAYDFEWGLKIFYQEQTDIPGLYFGVPYDTKKGILAPDILKNMKNKNKLYVDSPGSLAKADTNILMLAITNGFPKEIIRQIVDTDIDLNHVNANGKSAIDLAIYHELDEICEIIIRGLRKPTVIEFNDDSKRSEKS